MSLTLRPVDFANASIPERDAHIVAAYRAARNRNELIQGVSAPAVEDRVELETEEHGELIACIHAPQLVLIYGPAGFVCVSEGEGIEVEDDSLDDPMFEDDDEDSDDDSRDDNDEEDVGDPVESAESTRFVGTIDEFYADIKASSYGSAGSIWRYIMGAPREPLVVLQCNVAPAAIRVVADPRKGLNQGDALADALDSQWGGEFDNWVIEIELLRVGHARNPLVVPLVTFTFGNHANRKQD